MPPALRLPSAVEAKDQSHTERGCGVDQAQQQPYPAVGKDAGPHHTQDKGRAGIVAEGQQPLTLRLGALAVFIEGQSGPGTHGIPAHKAKGQRSGTGAVQVE